jgi:hypothetical protein
VSANSGVYLVSGRQVKKWEEMAPSQTTLWFLSRYHAVLMHSILNIKYYIVAIDTIPIKWSYHNSILFWQYCLINLPAIVEMS